MVFDGTIEGEGGRFVLKAERSGIEDNVGVNVYVLVG
jgi:hypothetical protein